MTGVSPGRIVLVDTSVMLELLEVPGKSDRAEEIGAEFDAKAAAGVKLMIPMAAVLETGSHIRRLKDGGERRRCAANFVRFLESALSRKKPWTFTAFDWHDDTIRRIIDGTGHGYRLIDSIGSGIFELGDLAIIEEWRATRANVARSWDVDVWTLDTTLRGVVDGLRASG